MEIICEIFSILSNKDLKNAALCDRSLNEIATPILYKRSTLSTLKALHVFMGTWSEDIPEDYAANVFLDPEKNKDVDTRLKDFLARVVSLFDIFVVFIISMIRYIHVLYPRTASHREILFLVRRAVLSMRKFLS